LPETPVIMANAVCPELGNEGGSSADPQGAARIGAIADLVRGAVKDGARLVDIGRPSVPALESVRAANPEVIICADTPGADLTRDPAIAARTGAALLRGACPGGHHASRGHPGPRRPGSPRGAGPGGRPTGNSPAAAEPVAMTSIGAALIEAAPTDAGALVAAGHTVLADADADEVAATIAVASVLVWLGVRVVRTTHVAAVRQALEMVESIRGTRPPSWARRGLA
jgi:hypothetical protein